jgi:uncharacterized protein YbjT (DUF2867 family)
MNVVLFGATGMVGQGVLRECLLDPEVTAVLSIVRKATGRAHPKLREIAHGDFWNFDGIAPALTGFDACFFCLGVSSNGMTEADYERVTYGITVAAAGMLCRLNPRMTFVFVSGAGADSSENGKLMWARVKGKTENALLKMPFGAVHVFRPGFIQPLHGIQSRTPVYRLLYAALKPVFPLLKRAFPDHVLTTEQIGRAMLAVAKKGAPKRILGTREIHAVSGC